MEISIIIPTFNRSKSLLRTIKSFANQDEIDNNYEIIIADNNSKDDTFEVVSRFISENKKNKFIYHFVPEQGVHFARNSAAKIAKGRILYFTDDDMEADSKLIKEIVSLFRENPNLATATGMVLPKFEIKPPFWITNHLDNQYLSLTRKDIPWYKIVSYEEEPIGIYSCHQAIKREAFFNCGGFNPENTKGIWLGDGETGLMKKLRKKNYLFGFTRKSIIYHHIPKSRLTRKYIVKRMINQAYSDSYSSFRDYRDLKKLIIKMLMRNIISLIKLFLHFLKSFLRQRSFNILIARVAYYLHRNIYDFKILSNKKFRATVMKDNWLI